MAADHKPTHPKKPRPSRRAAAFAVHLFTASGAVVGLLALTAAFSQRWTEMFLWLGLALLIDGVDGALARRAKVAEVLPQWSGDVLDLLVDFLNYVLVPAVAIASAGLVPPMLALPAAGAILVSSAIYFADRRMKTDDAYFRGFPAAWNVVAFYLFLLRPDPVVGFGVVVLFVALTFVPIYFVHPLRVRKWLGFNLLMLAAWTALAVIALAHRLAPPPLVTLGLVAAGLYFLVVGLVRSRRAKP